jgi:transcription termination factor NusB
MYALQSESQDIKELDMRVVKRIIDGIAYASTYRPKDRSSEDQEILMQIIEKLESIDDLIAENCHDISRVSWVVLSILRVGIYEIKYISDNKHKLGNVIKDYLNIAVAFSHDAEAGFINSILDKAVKN